jgi:hypothetical protein
MYLLTDNIPAFAQIIYMHRKVIFPHLFNVDFPSKPIRG